MEVWKNINGFCDYQISSFGRVKSKKGEIMKHQYNHAGYLVVGLRKNRKVFTKKIHRLVAKEFIPNHENKPEINHLNEDKTDNRVSNLEWSTREENMNHNGLKERLIKKFQKINIKKVYQFKNGKLIKEWFSISEAHRNGFNRRLIIKVAKGRAMHHKGFQWSYNRNA